MQSSRLFLGVLLACALAPARAAAWPELINVVTEHSPPSSMLDGQRVVGYNSDKVREMLTRAGFKHNMELLPWKRAYTQAIRQGDSCVYATTRTPEREPLFKWVGPIDQGEWILFARADHAFHIQSLDDVRNLRIGTYNGDAREEYLRSRGFQVESVQDELANPKKLLMNRIDLWAASMRVGSNALERHGLADKIVPVLVFKSIKVYLACNPAMPDAVIDKLNATLEAMARDGSIKKIERRYENWVDNKAK